MNHLNLVPITIILVVLTIVAPATFGPVLFGYVFTYYMLWILSLTTDLLRK